MNYLQALDVAPHPFLLQSWMALAWYQAFGKDREEVFL